LCLYSLRNISVMLQLNWTYLSLILISQLLYMRHFLCKNIILSTSYCNYENLRIFSNQSRRKEIGRNWSITAQRDAIYWPLGQSNYLADVYQNMDCRYHKYGTHRIVDGTDNKWLYLSNYRFNKCVGLSYSYVMRIRFGCADGTNEISVFYRTILLLKFGNS